MYHFFTQKNFTGTNTNFLQIFIHVLGSWLVLSSFFHLEVTWNTSYNFIIWVCCNRNVGYGILFCRGNETSMSCEVGVFDLDKPWEWFTVTTRQAIVTNLQWNKTGTRLLITDSTGLCQVWQMQVRKTVVFKKKLTQLPL